jgi:anti-sigma regulatory factor (Ser/Thr protein kinase)
MTTTSGPRHEAYRHGLLLHDTDEELIAGTRAFVGRGLASGADVLVHGTRERVDLMRAVLGAHPRLTYDFDEALYEAPMRTLFAYQHALAARPEPREFWVTGTVPRGLDAAEQAAWHRYESVVDETLGTYPFAALCTYDTRDRPASVIEAALASHRTVNVDLTDRDNTRYVEPAAFLAGPLAQRPGPPAAWPTAATVIHGPDHLSAARDLVRSEAYRLSAVSPRTIERFRVAVNEIVSNGLLHGRPPVHVTVWTDVGSLTCLVEDAGPGQLDPMAGYRHPDGANHLGLWVSRQLVDDLVIGSSPTGGCSVLLTVTEQTP